MLLKFFLTYEKNLISYSSKFPKTFHLSSEIFENQSSLRQPTEIIASHLILHVFLHPISDYKDGVLESSNSWVLSDSNLKSLKPEMNMRKYFVNPKPIHFISNPK